MIRFDSKSGDYSVDFGNVNVPQKSKLKIKKQLLPEEQDPILLIPTGSFVVFDNDTGKYYSRKKIEEEEEESIYDWEEIYESDDPDLNDADDVLDDMLGEMEDEELNGISANINTTLDDMIDALNKQSEQPDEFEEEEKTFVLSRNQFVKKHNGIMAQGIVRAIKEANTLIPKTVLEKVPEGLYDKAQMVKLSYDISAAQNEMDLDNAESDFNEAVQSKDLVFKRNFSNREGVVVHDVAENIYHVAWHGANAEGGNAKEDWKSIKSVMGTRFDEDAQFLRAERDLKLFMRHIAEINPEAKIHLVGYSLGGAKSLHLAEKYNFRGTHINAFVSPLAKYERTEINPALLAKQNVVRIVSDPFTAQSAIPPLRQSTHNREYTNLLPLKDNTKFDDGHSLEQFTSQRPRGVKNLVEKSNVVAKSLGHAALVGGAAFAAYQGVIEGKDNSGTLSEETYRGVLGATEATIPIVTGADIVESGIVGFTPKEISNAFSWVKNSIFGKKTKTEEPDAPPRGFTQVSGQGFVAPQDITTTPPPTRREFGPQQNTQPPSRRNFGPQSMGFDTRASPPPLPMNTRPPR